MRILELILENFNPILAGIGKERIDIDLRNSNYLINVFVGKIGSGKTYILSHLQPFATVGTMDVRNSDDPIIDGKDGLKEIWYDVNGTKYHIKHQYIWTSGKSHSKKSYIEKNGVELNPKGNPTSFNELILLEFGIDQSFMRLMRLGPNVINFINMKSTERKSYIASLLRETEYYLTLYKHWSADLRTINTKVSILMNKLNTFGNEPLEDLNEQMDELEEKREEVQSTIDSMKEKVMSASALITALLSGFDGVPELKKSIEDMKTESIKVTEDLRDMKEELEKYDLEERSLEEISKEIGRIESLLALDDEKLFSLENQYHEKEVTLNNLMDKRAMAGDPTHMETLKETYDSMLDQIAMYEKQLKNFTCKYSATFLAGFLEDLNLVNVLISEISQYDKNIVTRIYNSDLSILSYAREKLNVLNRRKIKIQKEMSNLQFSNDYISPNLLFLPPFCPTKSCPYYASHPSNIKKSLSGKNALNEYLISYQNELQEIDVEIYKYGEYPLIYSKISSFKEYWKRSVKVLKDLAALRESDPLIVITKMNHQVWYSYDKIVDTIDLLQKRDNYIELTEKSKEIKAELNKLMMENDEALNQDISRFQEEVVQLQNDIEATEKEKGNHQEKLKELNLLYVGMSERHMKEQELKEKQSLLDDILKNIQTANESYLRIESNTQNIEHLNKRILEEQSDLKKILDKMDQLRIKINDVSYTRSELDELLQEQKWMSHMVDAVSSKKGIPMVMVKLFFESCRNSINEMLYMVTEDEFYLEEFNISENEFLIPYTVNGRTTNDISKASQGQTSITSTALSFAVVKELGSIKYTIPLLDEMDAPLHSNDKQKFIAIMFQYLKDIGSEQCFIITHDENLFDGYPVQVIMTTDENINKERYNNAILV